MLLVAFQTSGDWGRRTREFANWNSRVQPSGLRPVTGVGVAVARSGATFICRLPLAQAEKAAQAVITAIERRKKLGCPGMTSCNSCSW